MKNSLETRLGIFVALAVIAAVVVIEMLGGPEHFMRGYHLSALFTNVQELKIGDRVKMAGVEVGRVAKIQLEGDQARVVPVYETVGDASSLPEVRIFVDDFHVNVIFVSNVTFANHSLRDLTVSALDYTKAAAEGIE